MERIGHVFEFTRHPLFAVKQRDSHRKHHAAARHHQINENGTLNNADERGFSLFLSANLRPSANLRVPFSQETTWAQPTTNE